MAGEAAWVVVPPDVGAPDARANGALRAPVVDPLATARRLAPAIRAAADEIERTRRIPEPLLADLFASGLLHLFLPKALGGSEAEPGTYFRTIAEVARHDASVGWNMFVANSAALIAPHLDPAAARTIYAGGK